MIVTRRITLRLGLILIAAVVLQVAFFSLIGVLGSTPDVLPVVVVSLGLLGGAVAGAVCGFIAGFLVDSVLLQTLGVSSLVLLSIGYLAGRYREGSAVSNRWTPALLAGGLTLVGATGFAALQLMLGVDVPVSLLIVREIIVQALLATLLALGIYPLLRRILAPALIDHQPSSSPRRLTIRGLRRRRLGRKPAPAAAGSTAITGSHRGARRRRRRGDVSRHSPIRPGGR